MARSETILLNTCTVCHDLGRPQARRPRDDWNDILGAMLNEGAMLSEQDYPVLLAYLPKLQAAVAVQRP
jgi:hypothetical protein